MGERIRVGFERIINHVTQIPERTGRLLQSGAERAKYAQVEAIRRTDELARSEAARRTIEAARHAPQKAEDVVIQSRERRLATEAQNRDKNPIQKWFSRGQGKVVKVLAEMIPSQFWWGPGDVITGAGAIVGKDFLTGDKLDGVDRILYGLSSAVPFVPSIVLVEPAKIIRRGIEEAVHSRKQGETISFVSNVRDVVRGARDIKSAVRNSRNLPRS